MPGSDTAGTARKPVSIYEIQHWIKFPDETAYVQVTEDTKADSSRDTNTYEPTYLDRKVQPKFVLGRTDTVEFEIDAMGPGGIQQKLGISPEECMAFGDYLNDCELLQAVGESYAMENAHPALKKLARYIAPGNDDNGVMRVVRERLGLAEA